MINIFQWFVSKLGYSLLKKIVWISYQTFLISAYVAFVLFFFRVVALSWSYIDVILNNLSTGDGSSIVNKVLCILDTMGFWAGFNAGFPFVINAVSFVLLISVSRVFLRFHQFIGEQIKSAIKLI